jgi:hypothetical protein
MVYSICVTNGVITILDNFIKIIKIDTEFLKIYITYKTTPNLELIIGPVYMKIISQADNSQSIKFLIENIRKDYLDIIQDTKTLINLGNSFHVNLMLIGNELKYFKCFIDILVKIQEIYTDSGDIGAIRLFLYSYNNTKSARN